MVKDIKALYNYFGQVSRMDNKIYELLLEMKKEIKEEFNTLHKRIDGLENQTLHGFREMKLHIENRNKEKELMIDFMQDKITELERKYYELSKRVEN
ncbi:hypothetical protein ACQYAD_08465 [Neobacillus sp. SM06]|uniref:hypothetical protein n=1 Tax=Neobacillus sp. SM06 TaxID=3422492 RepID=UPI003D280822